MTRNLDDGVIARINQLTDTSDTLRLEANAPRLSKADIRALGPDLTPPRPGDTFEVL